MPRSSTEPPPRPTSRAEPPWSTARPGPIDRCLRPRRALGRSTAELNAWGGYRGPGHRCLRPGRGPELSRPGPRRELASPTDAAAGPTDRPGPGLGPRWSHRPGRGCDRSCQHRPADLVLHGVVDIYLPRGKNPPIRYCMHPCMFAFLEFFDRLFRSTERVQRSPFDRLDARYHCGGSRRGPGHGAPTRYPYKESCMSNRDGILDSRWCLRYLRER